MTYSTSGASFHSLEQDHPELTHAVVASDPVLRSLAQRLEAPHDGTVWIHHIELAERAKHLAEHLETALNAARSKAYASAFALTRTAIEHQVLDELLLLADRYKQRYTDVADVEFRRWTSELANGAKWAANVQSLERFGRGAVIIRRGHDVLDDEGTAVEQISPYLPILERHQPTLGPPSVQQLHFNGIGELHDQEQWARQNRDSYRSFLRWDSLLDNLVLNDLATEQERVTLEVHYRFLSSFTHATRHGFEIIDRATSLSRQFEPNEHHVSELVLLYLAVVASRELRAFCAFVDARGARIGIADRPLVDSIANDLDRVSQHLWYVGQSPLEYDRFVEANRKVWKSWDKTGPIPANRQLPETIDESDVGYYTDPLQRLYHLHVGGNEMTTGFSHRPVWP